MTTPRLARSLDSLAEWRRALDRRVEQFATLLSEHDLLDADAAAAVAALRQRLGRDRLVLAFVAEFSRGKSELINAIFFADAGRRILPATPGRTTMCPVELAWDPAEPPGLSLLPIDTRNGPRSLAQWRDAPDGWTRMPLTLGDTAQMVQTFTEVTRVSRVPVEQARALGLWNDEDPADNPPQGEDGMVEVPAWRHALINYPHPLLRRGLVVIDTPGLNAIGAEPELTLNLLPSAHAAIFLLAADTGVTRSDLSVWNDHLAAQGLERFVVLNKVDMLADPLLDDQAIAQAIRRQCGEVASALRMPADRVFPLSARQALAARLGGDTAASDGSGLPALEQALTEQLLPGRAAVVSRLVEQALAGLQHSASRQLADRRRQNAEQMLELRSLRGKSQGKVDSLQARLDAEAVDFERCLPRLAAIRAVHSRHLSEALEPLSAARLRSGVEQMQRFVDASLLKIGSGKAFAALMSQIRADLEHTAAAAVEIEQMVAASYRQLNADFGFALAVATVPGLQRFRREFDLIEASYGRYFGARHIWRLSRPGFVAQFMRMLQYKLSSVAESAAAEIDAWSRALSIQLDAQLRDRRRAFQQRRDALQRISLATGDLERRIGEVESQDERLRMLAQRLDAVVAETCEAARQWPRESAAERSPQLQLIRSAGDPGRALAGA